MTDRPRFREFLQQLLREQARPAHKYGHQPRLYQLCHEIGEGLAYDDDVIFAAVYLHDLGVFEGNRPEDPAALVLWDHVAYAVSKAKTLLGETDFPEAKISQVIEVIEQHQPKDTPTSTEAVIVRDADILEQLGAVAVMRTAAKLGSDTRFYRFRDVRDALQRQLTALPGQIKLPSTSRLAASRIAALGAFLGSLQAETGDEIG